MALNVADRVQQTGTANTTVSFTLSGSVAGFQSFAVVGNTNTTYYTATDASGNWEVGLGTYSTTGPTLTRTTILSSSNSNAAVTFSGTVNVFVTYPAEKSVNQDANNRVLIPYTSGTTNVGSLNVGDATVHTDSGVIAGFTASEPLYLYTSLQNTDSGATSYASYAVNDGGHTAYGELGINNANYSYSTAGFPNNGFSIPLATFVESYGGPLVLGSWDNQKISFIVNGAVSTTDAMTINTNGSVAFNGQVGTAGQVLQSNATSAPTWVTPASGTVTSVGGTGTVSGLTLSGTVTNSGNLTLGGAITGFATSGANTNLTSVALTSGTVSTAPSSSSDIVNKSYADSIAAGVNFHAACQYATTAALPANTYNNGTGGVGATLTGNAVGTLTIDSYTLVSGDVGNRLLIKNEATQANNGVYTLTQAGTAGLPYILTRATDYDTSGSGTNEVDQGDLILVINGTTNANTSWVQQTPLPITIGTTAIVFIQFAAIQTYTAGTGLTLTTNQFSITNQGTAGTYGSASTVPVITTNAQGQVSSVTNTDIAISGGAVSGNIAGSAGSVANALTAGTGITFSSGTTYDGSVGKTISSLLAQGTSAFTTGTAQTYTAPANTQWVKVTVVGPGGNGGAATGQRATGGGGGGVAIKWLSMTAGQTLIYTVGTASGTASTVSSGTLTITTITANSGTNGTGTAYANSITAGGAGGTATNGDVNITGGQGGYSYGSGTTVQTNFGGKGGDCLGFGSGGPALAIVATAGVQGNGFGAGGGGAHNNATSAAGRGGIIIFEAY